MQSKKARMRTGYLGLRLLVGMALGRDVVMTAKAVIRLSKRANQTLVVTDGGVAGMMAV